MKFGVQSLEFYITENTGPQKRPAKTKIRKTGGCSETTAAISTKRDHRSEGSTRSDEKYRCSGGAPACSLDIRSTAASAMRAIG